MPNSNQSIPAVSTTEKKRVVLADRLAIMRVGLRAILSEEPTIEVVGEAANALSLLKAVEHIKPELIVMDAFIDGQTCIHLVEEIKRVNPQVRIALFAGMLPRSGVLEGLRAGINGYIVKTADKSELLLAIMSILKGQTYLSPEFAGHVVENHFSVAGQVPECSGYQNISRREQEVLRLVATGRTSKEIAMKLCISSRTVEKHRATLMRKLNIPHMAALVSYAIKNGFTERDGYH